MAADAAAPIAFERQATGLVREAGWWDVLVYNLNFISIGLMAAFLFNTTRWAGIYNVAIFLSGFVIYFVARALNRRRGVEIGKRFAEIPIE
jgi:hypothetical protein